VRKIILDSFEDKAPRRTSLQPEEGCQSRSRKEKAAGKMKMVI
jgi:hypothetical protein